MKKFKKLTSALLSIVTAAAMVLPLELNASAKVINYKWSVDCSAPKQDDHIGWVGDRNTDFSVDQNVHTEDDWYSIKLENKDYNISYVERTYNVEPYTQYKFSAMVKYSGYALDPKAEADKSGACVGKAFSWNHSDFSVSSNWTKVEYEFTTGNETTYNLCLQNGIYNGKCKGTAWFSDVKLEKADVTNNWDILAVIFKNIDATIPFKGETIRFQKTLSQSMLDDISKYALDTLPSVFKEMSNDKLNINSIDRYVVDVTLTKKDLIVNKFQDDAKTIPSGYCIDPSKSELIGKTLDKYLAQKNYNQILIFLPLNGKDISINGGWWGLGGTKYKDVNFAQIASGYDNKFKNDPDFQGAVCFHEITHGMEHASKIINGDKTPSLDNDRDVYQKKYGLTAKEWYSGYWNATLPDGRGLDPSVFYRPTGKYTVVDSSMETGVGITPGSDSLTPPAPKTLTVKPANDAAKKVEVNWSAVKGATGYTLTLFDDPEHKTVLKDFDFKRTATGTKLSPITTDIPYYYGIRAKYTINGKTVYSDWTYLTYTLNTSVVHGDVNGDGSFNVGDVTALINMILNDTVTDRAYEATNTAKGTSLNVSHVLALIKDFLNS